MALAPLLYNITFDSQTRILYFWDKAGHEIYHCEISPAPVVPDYFVFDNSENKTTFGVVNSMELIIIIENNQLPTVSIRDDYSSYNWIYVKSDQSVASLVANASLDTYYYDTSQPIPSYYDTNKSYAVIQWQTTAGTTAGRIECAFENNGGYLAIKNVSSATISIKQARVAVCSSNLATVVTVYNGSNVAYNAFKFTSDGTDYYYVLDGTQTDWTDDLSSIGYHIPVLVTSYLTNLGASATTNFGLSTNSMYQLYDSSGSMLLYDSTKTYSIISANRINSQYPDWSSSDLQSLSIGHYSDYLHLVTGNNIPYQNGIYSVTYTVL